MAGLKLTHIPKEGVRRWEVPVGQEDSQGLGVDLAGHRRVSEDDSEFRTKDDATAVVLVVERFDAHVVTSQQELLVVSIPHGETEHAVEAGRDLRAPSVVAMDDCLGVR